MSLRAATYDDRDAVFALGVAEEAAWFGEPEVNAAEVGEWIDEEGGVGIGAVSVGPDGRVRGFASPGRSQTVLIADPAQTDAVVDDLLPWLQTHGAVRELYTFGDDAARLAAFERHGLHHHRSAFSLIRLDIAGPLPAPEFPEGVDIVPYRLGEADDDVHRLIYVDAAWASVPGHVERDLAAWRDMTNNCSSLFLARDGDRLVAWTAGRVLESGRGYITTIAVAQSERGRGLGRAMLLHAFADLQAAGATDLTLGVQAQNESALRLYRSVGLEVEREWRIYAS